MSNARVNLLPGEVEEKNRQRRAGVFFGGAGLFLLALLALGYVWQVGRVNEAQDRLDQTQQELQAAQTELSTLNEFRELQARADAATELLQVTLGSEVSFAGVLQDIAAVMPSEAELSAINIALSQGDGEDLGDLIPSIGALTIAGQTLDGHAPGLERLLLEFDKIAAFSDVFFSSSTVDERNVATFNAEIDLGREILTGRYTDGLPEALR